MNISEIKLKEIKSSEGMTLTNGEVFSKLLYLGVNDSIENWYEIPDEEAERIQKEREEEELRKIEAGEMDA